MQLALCDPELLEIAWAARMQKTKWKTPERRRRPEKFAVGHVGLWSVAIMAVVGRSQARVSRTLDQLSRVGFFSSSDSIALLRAIEGFKRAELQRFESLKVTC